MRRAYHLHYRPVLWPHYEAHSPRDEGEIVTMNFVSEHGRVITVIMVDGRPQ
jgi:hypothetical protein